MGRGLIRAGQAAAGEVAGPGPRPAPGVTSASGIAKKTHDDRALCWIADAVPGTGQRHARWAPAAPELRKGQARTIGRRGELSAGPADRGPRRVPGRARPGPRR